MKFDVIIPTYKPDGKFRALIAGLMNQSRKPDRILVINTEEAFWEPIPEALACMEVIHIAKQDFNHGGTRRMAAERSEADFFVCMTQDAVPADTHLLENLLKAFQDETVGAAYARQLADGEAGVIEQYTRRFNYPKESRVKRKQDEPQLGIKTWFCSDVCAAYRKKAYLLAGGFVERTIFNEDMLMAQKLIELGYGVAYRADARVYHSHRYSCRQQFQRNFDLGVSHREFRDIFEQVSSEAEGMRMVKQTAKYLIKSGRIYLIPELVLQSGAKLLGYQAGKWYDKLPISLVRKLSATPGYFEDRN